MKIAVWILKLLVKVFGQDTLWEAFKEIAERRTVIKIAKFEERAEVRKIKNEIDQIRLEKKKKRREDKQARNRNDKGT